MTNPTANLPRLSEFLNDALFGQVEGVVSIRISEGRAEIETDFTCESMCKLADELRGAGIKVAVFKGGKELPLQLTSMEFRKDGELL